MTYIRHNARTGKNYLSVVAHDTDQKDVTGAHCAGRVEKVYTSEASPCPQCGGWGELVSMQDASTKYYPQGKAMPLYMARTGRSVETEETEQTEETDHPEDIPVETERQVETEREVDEVGDVLLDRLGLRGALDAAVIAAVAQSRTELVAAFDSKVRALTLPREVIVKRPDAPSHKVDGIVHPAFDDVLAILAAGCHVYLVGPAGCGKTTLAEQVAEALDTPFYLTSMVMADHDVRGFVDAGGRYHGTPWRQAFQHGGLHLGDEVDAWSPEALLAMNAGLANGYAAFPDTVDPIPANRDFRAIVAANTWGDGADLEYVGRVQLDAASKSRFVTVPMDYDPALETLLAQDHREWLATVHKVRARTRELRLQHLAGTRELLHGLKLLRAGMDPEKVTRLVLRRNLDDATWQKVSK